MARTKKSTVATPSIVEELIDALVQPDSTPIEEAIYEPELPEVPSDVTIDGPVPEPVDDEEPKPVDDEAPKAESPTELAYAVICAAVTKKRCVSTVAKKLIFEGLTNEQVYAELDAEFSIGEAKKSYPSWYRNDMIKKGIIARAEKTVKAPKAKVEKTVNALVIEDVIVEETTY